MHGALLRVMKCLQVGNKSVVHTWLKLCMLQNVRMGHFRGEDYFPQDSSCFIEDGRRHVIESIKEDAEEGHLKLAKNN